MSTVGIVANPAAGKDVRRLVAHAAPVADGTKIGVVRRAVIGAAGAGVDRVVLSRDARGLTERAVENLDVDAEIVVLDEPVFGDRTDTVAAARRFAKQGSSAADTVGAVIVLGGDGTARDVAAGWLDAPMIALSTGTNNVFPAAVEPTVAGMAAAAVARGAVPLDLAADRMNAIHVRIERAGGPVVDDVALVEVALLAERFTGSRAVWDPATLREVVACIAEPAAVGLSAVAGLVHPSPRTRPGGVHVRFGGHRLVRAPMLPGVVAELPVGAVGALAAGAEVPLVGPGVVSFDGERDVVLADGDTAWCQIELDGPWVIDPGRALEQAAARGFVDGC